MLSTLGNINELQPRPGPSFELTGEVVTASTPNEQGPTQVILVYGEKGVADWDEPHNFSHVTVPAAIRQKDGGRFECGARIKVRGTIQTGGTPQLPTAELVAEHVEFFSRDVVAP